MRRITRLSVTLRLIRCLLFPPDTPDVSAAISLHLPGSCRTVSPDALCRSFANWGEYADSRGEFTLIVPGALHFAAPFVLFRLKRWGFSGCRVMAEREGLRIQGRR